MLDISQLTLRFLLALALGVVMGVERNLVGKEAGVRTSMLVAGGAALFTLIGLQLPYIAAVPGGNVGDIIANSSFFNIIANIVVGVGFLGAGIIIQTREHVHGLTTAAAVWATAAIGILAGIGLMRFACIATILMAGFLYLLRNLEVTELINKKASPKQ